MQRIKIESHVRRVRIDKGWTQAELAATVGVARQTINAIEMGRSVPTLGLALELAGALEKRIGELFHFESRQAEIPGPLGAHASLEAPLERDHNAA